MDMMNALKKFGVNTLVFTNALNCEALLDTARVCGINCISTLDTRSAVYLATGIAAQNHMPVVVLVDSGSSRSAFSGMTEAYYRKLPIILVTIGKNLDYSIELRDVALSHHIVSGNNNDWDTILAGGLPMHVEFLNPLDSVKRWSLTEISEILSPVLGAETYLYIGQGIQLDTSYFKCKVVHGGLTHCSDGALSNVLGASLAKVRNRYIGMVSEEEFLHDMNALGNVNVNDSLLFFVITSQENQLIIDYACSLGFEAIGIRICELTQEIIRSLVANGKRTVVMLYKK